MYLDATRRHGLVIAAALLGAGLAACGSDTSSTTAGGPTAPGIASSASLPPVAAPTASTLPFHYDGAGQGGSSPFTVAATADYKVAWTAAGISGSPACTVSIGLSGSSSSFTVVDGVQVGPTDKKNGTVTLHLVAGSYRAVEGGGCSWSITVGA
jgi:hypothetical protein